MKVAIDAQRLGSQRGGDETYTRNIIRALGALDPEGDYTLLLDQPLPDLHIPGVEHMRRLVIPQRRFVRIPISLPLAAARNRIDVLHTQYAAPPLSTARVVVTIYDISFEHYPQFFTPADAMHLRVLVPLAVRRASIIITISEFCKRDIMRRYCVPPERIVVAPCAADPAFQLVRDAEHLSAVRERYGTSERFILCVSNLQPRKNLARVVEAYVRLRRAGATRHKLVLVGRKGHYHDDIFAAARASRFDDAFVFTGYVPDTDLVALYNAADLFVYPSLFEGFGLPPLEAMACGTPVVTSNTSAIPETVGDAALAVDPLDVEALASAMSAVLGNADLHARLAVHGLHRAGTFSWENTARTILNAYYSVSRKR